MTNIENKPDNTPRIVFHVILALILLFLTIWFGLRLFGFL